VIVGSFVGVFVGVVVGVPVGALVGVFVGVLVGVLVAVLVAVFVGVLVFVDVLVGVFVGVLVGVFDGVLVGVLVGVFVGVFVRVGVQARIETLLVALPVATLLPSLADAPVAVASIRSWKTMLLEPQAGAVSCTLPVQVSVAVPLGPSDVTGLPPWLQGADVVVPPGKGSVLVTERLVMLLLGSRFVIEKLHVNVLPGATGPSGQVLETERPTVIDGVGVG